jgi:hypothetical protein
MVSSLSGEVQYFIKSTSDLALWLNFEVYSFIHAIEWKTLTFTPCQYQFKIESIIVEELNHKTSDFTSSLTEYTVKLSLRIL